jgi:hypothetical protein
MFILKLNKLLLKKKKLRALKILKVILDSKLKTYKYNAQRKYMNYKVKFLKSGNKLIKMKKIFCLKRL